MNVNTGELYKMSPEMETELMKDREKNFKKLFEQVPKEYEEEALKELGDNDYVKVDMNKNTPLVNWAKKKRKNKMAKKSRKKNRK